MAMDIVFSPKYLWMVKIYIWKCLEISLRIPLSQRLPPRSSPHIQIFWKYRAPHHIHLNKSPSPTKEIMSSHFFYLDIWKLITFRVTSAILICSRTYLFIKIPENDQNFCSKNQLSFTDPFFSSMYLIKSLFSDVQMKKKSCWNSVGSLNINFVHIRKF